MKKFLILLLIIFITPSIFVFGACGEKKVYNTKELATRYYALADGKDIVTKENDTLAIKFSAEFESKLQTEEIFENAFRYNEVLEDLLCFSNAYIGFCSSEEILLSETEYNQLYNSLSVMNNDLNNVNSLASTFSLMALSSDDETCMQVFRNWLTSYNNLLCSAGVFTNHVSTIYFQKILNIANPDYTNLTADQLSSSAVLSRLNARLKYQRSNLARLFSETRLVGEELLDFVLVKKINNIDLTSYNSQIAKVDRVFDINATVNNKEAFYNLTIQAQNYQETLLNNNYMYLEAMQRINYVDQDESEDRMVQIYVGIIDNLYDVVLSYNDVLAGMLNEIGA